MALNDGFIGGGTVYPGTPWRIRFVYRGKSARSAAAFHSPCTVRFTHIPLSTHLISDPHCGRRDRCRRHVAAARRVTERDDHDPVVFVVGGDPVGDRFSWLVWDGQGHLDRCPALLAAS